MSSLCLGSLAMPLPGFWCFGYLFWVSRPATESGPGCSAVFQPGRLGARWRAPTDVGFYRSTSCFFCSRDTFPTKFPYFSMYPVPPSIFGYGTCVRCAKSGVPEGRMEGGVGQGTEWRDLGGFIFLTVLLAQNMATSPCFHRHCCCRLGMTCFMSTRVHV